MRRLLCASRNNDLLRCNSSVLNLAGPRPAGSHCENSGSSDGSGASARSDRAQTAQILRDRSASAGGGTRYYSPCLIFWCFWIKTKARKKESKRIFFRSILRETILPLRLCVSCKERIYHLCHRKVAPKRCPQGTSVGIGRRFSLSDHTRSAPFAHDRSGVPSFVRSVSVSGTMRKLWCAARNDDYLLVSCFNRSPACRIALRK